MRLPNKKFNAGDIVISNFTGGNGYLKGKKFKVIEWKYGSVYLVLPLYKVSDADRTKTAFIAGCLNIHESYIDLQSKANKKNKLYTR